MMNDVPIVAYLLMYGANIVAEMSKFHAATPVLFTLGDIGKNPHEVASKEQLEEVLNSADPDDKRAAYFVRLLDKLAKKKTKIKDNRWLEVICFYACSSYDNRKTSQPRLVGDVHAIYDNSSLALFI